MDNSLSSELLSFFENYLSFYKDFLQLETDKYNDLEANCLDVLQDRIKTEEVYMLRSRGLEIERDKLLAKANFPKTTFRELIPLFDPPVRRKIDNIYQELSQVLLDLKEMNRRCNNLTQIRLHHINSELEKLKKQGQNPNVYTSKADNSGKLTGILSKKI